jgi:hypothetical protein
MRTATRASRPTREAAPWVGWYTTSGFTANQRSRSLFEMIRRMRDYNPDVSKAVENFVTLSNPGYTLNVYFAGRTDADGAPVADPEGQRIVQNFAARMFGEYSGAWDDIAGTKNSNYPGLDSYIAMCHLMVGTVGAFAAEVELSDGLDNVNDVFPVDPTIIDFEEIGGRIMAGIRTGGFTPLDPMRFRYIGKDPDVNAPWGRSPLLAVLDVVFFQQEFMRELKAIAHQVNAPRLLVKVIEEKAINALKNTRPDLMAAGREAERQEFLDAILGDIRDVIENLEVDDAFIVYDSVEAEYIHPTGTAIPVKDIMSVIDREVVSATKQLPILLGRNEGATTTHATVQWQVYIEQLKSFQRISSAFVSWVLNLLLRVNGRQSYVHFEYKKHKTSDETADATALATKVNAFGMMVDRGWISDDEAAIALTGHKANGTPRPAPEPQPAPTANNSDGENMARVVGEPLPKEAANAVSDFSTLEQAILTAQYAMLPDLARMNELYPPEGD